MLSEIIISFYSYFYKMYRVRMLYAYKEFKQINVPLYNIQKHCISVNPQYLFTTIILARDDTYPELSISEIPNKRT